MQPTVAYMYNCYENLFFIWFILPCLTVNDGRNTKDASSHTAQLCYSVQVERGNNRLRKGYARERARDWVIQRRTKKRNKSDAKRRTAERRMTRMRTRARPDCMMYMPSGRLREHRWTCMYIVSNIATVQNVISISSKVRGGPRISAQKLQLSSEISWRCYQSRNHRRPAASSCHEGCPCPVQVRQVRAKS